MEDDESQLFKIIKSILYAFLIGAFFYAGGYGYALLFTKDEEKRDNVAKWNLIALVLEILLFVVIFIIKMFQDEYNYGVETLTFIFKSMLIHAAISFLGSLIYLVWWIGGMF